MNSDYQQQWTEIGNKFKQLIANNGQNKQEPVST